MRIALNVLGSGVITPSGRGWGGQDVLAETSGVASHIYRLPADALRDREVLKKLRRADRFSKMAALSGWDAMADAGLSVEAGYAELGIIATTALGPHHTTFAFLDEILDFGDAGVSPTRFSHSVHNAAAAYVAIMLGSRGPTSTIADFVNPFYTGCLLASVWLREERCQQVLVSYTEESSDPMEYIARKLQDEDTSVSLQPLHFSVDPEARLSEGSLSLVFSLAADAGPPLDIDRLSRVGRIADVGALLGKAVDKS